MVIATDGKATIANAPERHTATGGSRTPPPRPPATTFSSEEPCEGCGGALGEGPRRAPLCDECLAKQPHGPGGLPVPLDSMGP